MALSKEEKIARLEERRNKITWQIWALGDRERELQDKLGKIQEKIDELEDDFG